MADRILLDANAILNAAFVPQSWSRMAVELERRQGASLFVGERSLSEAFDKAIETARGLGKASNPCPIIEAFVRSVGAIQVPPNGVEVVPAGIPNHDSHVILEAKTARAEILTSDSELWLACKRAGIPAVLPLELIRRCNSVSLSTAIFGVPPTKERGAVFARAYAGGWAGMSNVGRFTIIDFPGFVWLYYCTVGQRWVAELADGKHVVADAAIANSGELQTVGLSWQAGTHIRLRVATLEHPTDSQMAGPLVANLTAPARIGSHSSGNHFWNGAIYVCVMNDRPIGRDAWADMRRDRELTPNPFDSDRLRSAMNVFLH